MPQRKVVTEPCPKCRKSARVTKVGIEIEEQGGALKWETERIQCSDPDCPASS